MTQERPRAQPRERRVQDATYCTTTPGAPATSKGVDEVGPPAPLMSTHLHSAAAAGSAVSCPHAPGCTCLQPRNVGRQVLLEHCRAARGGVDPEQRLAAGGPPPSRVQGKRPAQARRAPRDLHVSMHRKQARRHQQGQQACESLMSDGWQRAATPACSRSSTGGRAWQLAAL